MRCACFCQVMPVLAVHRSLRALQAVFSPPHTYISIQVKLGRDPQQEFATWCAEVQMASCIIQRFNARINGGKDQLSNTQLFNSCASFNAHAEYAMSKKLAYAASLPACRPYSCRDPWLC